MFILSLGKKQILRRFFIIFAFAAVSAVIISAAYCFAQEKKKYREFDGKKLCLEINNIQDAKDTAAFFGADTSSASVSCESVRIPLNFNDIYIRYNEMQKDLGSDLENFKGRSCLKYSIKPAENGDAGVTYTLLVCDGRLIGGDISENDFDGSIRGLYRKDNK